MTLLRRQFLHLSAGAVVLPALSRAIGAQSYPSRTIRVIVGLSPGGLDGCHGARGGG